MKMAIDVYEYGRGGKCVYKFSYTYAGFRIINMQIEKVDRHMSRVPHERLGSRTCVTGVNAQKLGNYAQWRKNNMCVTYASH